MMPIERLILVINTARELMNMAHVFQNGAQCTMFISAETFAALQYPTTRAQDIAMMETMIAKGHEPQ